MCWSRGGWCLTCPRAVKAKDCKEWGWCAPGCDGSLDKPSDDKEFWNKIHELPVDSFVYENCSLNVDTLSEFCTGKLQYFITLPPLLAQVTPMSWEVRPGGATMSKMVLNC